MKYRKFWLPTASAGGVLFFCLCDYANYPDVVIAFTFIWLYYAIFLITSHTSVSVHRDANGDLNIVDKESEDAVNHSATTKNSKHEDNQESIKAND
jgi:hypothetical protein